MICLPNCLITYVIAFSQMHMYVSYIVLQVVTKKIVDNGVETVIVEEDGVMTQKTINGHQVALEY